MPASDPPGGPQDDAGSSIRSYAVSAATAAAVCAAGVVLLNLLVDPSGLLGLRHRLWSDRTMPWTEGVLRTPVVDLDLAAEASADAATYLVGTSRYQFGFDVCRFPGIRKVALFGADLGDIVRAQDVLLDAAQRPRTLVLEVTETDGPRPGGPALPGIPLAAQWATLLFSYDATVASLKYLGLPVETVAGETLEQKCAAGTPIPSGVTPAQRLKALQGADKYDDSLPRLRRLFLQALESAELICHERHLRHRIRWLLLPPTWDSDLTPMLAKGMERWRQAISESLAAPRPHRGACDIAFVDHPPEPRVAPGTTWRNRSMWIDYTHFSGDLGATTHQVLPGVFPGSPAAP